MWGVSACESPKIRSTEGTHGRTGQMKMRCLASPSDHQCWCSSVPARRAPPYSRTASTHQGSPPHMGGDRPRCGRGCTRGWCDQDCSRRRASRWEAAGLVVIGRRRPRCTQAPRWAARQGWDGRSSPADVALRPRPVWRAKTQAHRARPGRLAWPIDRRRWLRAAESHRGDALPHGMRRRSYWRRGAGPRPRTAL